LSTLRLQHRQQCLCQNVRSPDIRLILYVKIRKAGVLDETRNIPRSVLDEHVNARKIAEALRQFELATIGAEVA
jgi:hypothetical protein